MVRHNGNLLPRVLIQNAVDYLSDLGHIVNDIGRVRTKLMGIAIQVSVFIQSAACKFLEINFIDFRHSGKRCASNEHFVEKEVVLVTLTNDFSHKRYPFQPQTIYPEIDLNIRTHIEVGTNRLEVVVPGIKGDFVCVLFENDGFYLGRIGVGQFGLLVLIQVCKTPDLGFISGAKGGLYVIVEVGIDLSNIIGFNLAGGEPFDDFGLLRFCGQR